MFKRVITYQSSKATKCLTKLDSNISFSTVSERSNWKSVVGLEIHAQINTAAKLFSASSTLFGSSVNNNVSYFDAAIPGTLPVLNRKCVEAAVLTALALSCKINPVSSFDRKHYFYADLPAGYQITQQRSPLASNGVVDFHVFTPGVHKVPYKKSSRIKQIQLEQDSGKSLHDEVEQRSLIDLNRAGVPLMELVFEPDLSDGEEAAALVKELSLILTRLNTCSCKMEEGALRVDVNISVHQNGEKLGTRTEVKNIGSVRGVAKAINYEIQRQIKELQNGNAIINETRAWDAATGTTLTMRDKEVKQDYRFMPEPNLPPLRLNTEQKNKNGLVSVENLKKILPELPEETRQKLKTKYNLSNVFTMHIVSEEILLNYFMALTSQNPGRDANVIGKILCIELLTFVNKGAITLDFWSSSIHPLGEIIDMLQSGQINLVSARKLLQEIINGNSQNPTKIVQEMGWMQIVNHEELEQLCREVLTKNPQIVAKYKSGKTKVFFALVGQVAKSSNNRANLEISTRILKELIESSS